MSLSGGQRICDLCGDTRYELICDRDRCGQPWRTVACTTCGLVGHEVIPTEQQLEEFYARQYRQEYHGESVPSHRRIMRAWYKGERVVRQLQPTMRPGDRVFEVGAGLGLNVKQFELAGYQACGIEPSHSFQTYARNRLRARIEQGSLFDYRADQPFDLVLLIHVIEHFRSPRQALHKIFQLLKAGGRLYLECPSLATWHARRCEMFHFAHIHTFTPPTLLHLTRQCGFELHTCFSSGLGLNHKMLFVKTQPRHDLPLPCYETTLEILRDYHAPWHRLQGWYLWGRLRRWGIYLREWLLGPWVVRDVLRRCQRQAPAPLRRSA